MEIGQPLRQTQTGNVESICFVRFLQDQSKKYAMDSYGDTFNKHNEWWIDFIDGSESVLRCIGNKSAI